MIRNPYIWCSQCDALLLGVNHSCPPLWDVCDPSVCDERWVTVRAKDESSAAEAGSELLDRVDSKPQSHDVLVKPHEKDGPITKWSVEVEVSARYYAKANN